MIDVQCDIDVCWFVDIDLFVFVFFPSAMILFMEYIYAIDGFALLYTDIK